MSITSKYKFKPENAATDNSGFDFLETITSFFKALAKSFRAMLMGLFLLLAETFTLLARNPLNICWMFVSFSAFCFAVFASRLLELAAGGYLTTADALLLPVAYLGMALGVIAAGGFTWVMLVSWVCGAVGAYLCQSARRQLEISFFITAVKRGLSFN